MSFFVIIEYYCPPGVIAPCDINSFYYIGQFTDDIVFKYLLIKNEWLIIKIESQMYKILDFYPRILACFGFDKYNLKFKFAVNKTIKKFILSKSILLLAKKKVV